MQAIYRCSALGAVIFGTLAYPSPAGAQADGPPSVIALIDGSGSMWGALDASRQSKFLLVREALRAALGKVGGHTRVGLAAFGHRRAGDCADVEIVREPEPLDADRIMASLAQFNPRGRGPLTLALREAAKSLPSSSGARRLLLIHDDADNCQADLCAAATELRSAGITVHVVAVGAKADDIAKMACLTQLTGGRHFNAQNSEQVASFIGEALSLASADPDVKKAPAQPPPHATPLVPPRPIPASGPPALHLRALFAPNAAPVTTPLRWIVSAEGQRGIPVFQAWATDPVVPLAPGRYTIEASDDLVSAQQVIATADRPMAVTLVLNAGRVDVRVRAQKTGAPLNDAIITISNAGSGSGGRKDATAGGATLAAYKADSASALLPAGRFVVRAELGLLHAEKVVTVSAGQTAPVELSLNAARLQLTTAGRDGLASLEKPVFSVQEDDPDAPSGRREIARSAARPAEFFLPPGTYYVIAQQGSIEARERLAIGPGDVLKRTLTAPAGRLSLSARAAGGTLANSVSYTIQRIDDTAQEPVTTSEPSPVLFLAPGRYRVEGRYGLMNVTSTREIEVRAGQVQELAFEHQVAILRLRFLAGVAATDIFWSIRDGDDRAVWTSAQPETVATLLGGSYRVSAETRDKRYERQVDLRVGESRVIDISGD